MAFFQRWSLVDSTTSVRLIEYGYGVWGWLGSVLATSYGMDS